MSSQDVRWEQRFHNYTKALAQLKEAVQLSRERTLSKLEEQGLIKAFEYTHELAWTVLQDYFKAQGNTNIRGSRDAIREAFKQELIADGDIWMETIRSRISTVHTYHEETAHDIAHRIVHGYYHLFIALKNEMEKLISNTLED